MSYTTITQCARDVEFQDRVLAGAMKEAIAGGIEYSGSVFAETVRASPIVALNTFMWPLSVDNEAAYEFAVGNDNPSPGGDPGVITDANIQAGIQAHWPLDAPTLPQPLDPTLTP